MKKLLCLAAMFVSALLPAFSQETYITPSPKSISYGTGHFTLPRKYSVSLADFTDGEMRKEATQFVGSLDRTTGYKGKLKKGTKGTFVLLKDSTIESEISFVKMTSYQGTESTGKVKKLVGLNEDIEGRTVVIVEDIVDSGLTMEKMIEYLKEFKPAEIHICTLLLKPDNLKRNLDIEYIAMEIPNDFIVGYGLDYDGLGRNLRDIYVVKE